MSKPKRPAGPQEAQNGRPRQYLLRFWCGEMKVVAGPFTPYDDEVYEAAFVDCLKEHPWDLEPEYRALLIDEKGHPEVEDFLSDYLAALYAEAWESIPQQVIGRLKEEPPLPADDDVLVVNEEDGYGAC